AAVPVRRRVPTADRRPAVGAVVVKAAAPAHSARALDRIRPLPDVPVEVVETKTARWIRAHFRGASQVRPLGRAAGGIAAVEVGLRGGEVVGGLVEVEVEGALFFGTGPTPTSIFPLFLRRQAIHPATRCFFSLIQFPDKLLGILPRNVL